MKRYRDPVARENLAKALAEHKAERKANNICRDGYDVKEVDSILEELWPKGACPIWWRDSTVAEVLQQYIPGIKIGYVQRWRYRVGRSLGSKSKSATRVCVNPRDAELQEVRQQNLKEMCHDCVIDLMERREIHSENL